jgi:AcrR family transcriptional regulator
MHRNSCNQPVQSRSRETLERLLDAAEALLHERPFEAVSVADIVRRAGSSVGSFYARFASKEALLPAIYDRYDAEFRTLADELIADVSRTGLSLAEICRTTVSHIVRWYGTRRWLMRAIALHVRTTPEQVPASARDHRATVQESWIAAFLARSDEIRHPDPRKRVEVGLLMVVAAVRERMVFSEAPHADTVTVPDHELEEELSHALYVYLTSDPS